MSDESSVSMKGVNEKFRLARDHVIVGVADAVNSGVDAAYAAKDKAADGMDALIDQGKDLVEDTAEVIRSRPWATVGVALAVGYVIAKLTGRN